MIDEFMAEDDLELVEVHINMKTIYTSTMSWFIPAISLFICFDYIVIDCINDTMYHMVLKNIFLHVLFA